jgi:phosphoglycerate dehydrogenase-like enzyme
MDIGIVGSGKIGGVVGKLWAQAGHRVRAWNSVPLLTDCPAKSPLRRSGLRRPRP